MEAFHELAALVSFYARPPSSSVMSSSDAQIRGKRDEQNRQLQLILGKDCAVGRKTRSGGPAEDMSGWATYCTVTTYAPKGNGTTGQKGTVDGEAAKQGETGRGGPRRVVESALGAFANKVTASHPSSLSRL